MSPFKLLRAFLLLAATINVSAFGTTTGTRRAFMDVTAASVLAGIVSPALAVDDLAMPTPEEQKAMDVSTIIEWLLAGVKQAAHEASPAISTRQAVHSASPESDLLAILIRGRFKSHVC